MHCKYPIPQEGAAPARGARGASRGGPAAAARGGFRLPAPSGPQAGFRLPAPGPGRGGPRGGLTVGPRGPIPGPPRGPVPSGQPHFKASVKKVQTQPSFTAADPSVFAVPQVPSLTLGSPPPVPRPAWRAPAGPPWQGPTRADLSLAVADPSQSHGLDSRPCPSIHLNQHH